MEHTDEQLAHYRNPEYWDGYILGQTGPDTVKSTIDNSPRAVMRGYQDQVIAWRALRTKLESMHTYWPDQTLGPGEVFDPNDHAPGTVVSLGKEDMAISRKADSPLTYYDYSQVEPPKQIIYLPDLSPKSTNARQLRSPSFRYYSQPRWSVVVDGPDTNILVSTYDRFVSCVNGEPKILPIFIQTTPDIFPVGSVVGGIRNNDENVGKPSTDYFARFTYLHIFEQGTKKRRPHRIIEKLTKLAIGELPKADPAT